MRRSAAAFELMWAALGAFTLLSVSCGTTEEPPADGASNGSGADAVSDADVLDTSAPRVTCDDAAVPSGFVCVRAGTYVMGVTSDTPFVFGPARGTSEVTLTRDFWIQDTETTQGAWKALSGGINPSCFQSPTPTFRTCSSENNRDDAPVEQVDWYSTLTFANALSRQEGLDVCYMIHDCVDPERGWFDGAHEGCTDAAFVGLDCNGYRLPTDAEWEYAARAGTTTITHNGNFDYPDSDGQNFYDRVLDPIAWYEETANGSTHPGRQLLPNAWGLYDTLGNVAEWLWDGETCGGTLEPTLPTSAVDPLGPVEPCRGHRLCAGQYWGTRAGDMTIMTRSMAGSDAPYNNLGFRLARTVR